MPFFAFETIILYICSREGDRGRTVPIIFLMPMDKKKIFEAMEPVALQMGCFIVDTEVSRDNDITITFDKEEGTVSMDDCVAMNDAFLAAFDRDDEDYSLTVSSAGLDQPLKDPRQFRKAIGTKVDVLFKGGRRIVGELTAAGPDSVCLRYVAREAVEGKKRKVEVTHDESFPLEGINSVKPWIDFK